MDNREQLRRITELTEQIAGLPKGYLSKKTIGGKVYYYHQWSENGVKQSRYLHDSEIAPLADKIEKRKELQAQLRMLKSQKSRRNEATGMKCTFMHKRTPVAEIELDDVTGFIQKIGSVYAPEHLPIGIPVRNEIADRAAFNDWWRDRSIPASRSGVREALESLGMADTKMLLVRCYGLSLSDQYWICPEGAELRWEDINFFQNDFSEDIGCAVRRKKEEGRTQFQFPRQHIGRQSEKAVEDHRWEAMPDQGRQQSVPAAAVQRGDRLRHHGAARHSSCIVYSHLEQGCTLLGL